MMIKEESSLVHTEVGENPTEHSGSKPEAATQPANARAGENMPQFSDESEFRRIVRNFTPSYVLRASEQTLLRAEAGHCVATKRVCDGPDGSSSP